MYCQVATHQGIVDELRAWILGGRLVAGERLPSENELAEHYGTSRPTVRRALALLKADGLVVTEQGQEPEQRVREVGSVVATEEIAARLGVDHDAYVVVRRRLFLVNGEPVALSDSYYPRVLAEGTALSAAENIEGGAYRVIEDELGRQLQRSVDEVECRMPTPAEVETLALPPGVPVIRILRTVYDSDGAAVEVQETIAAADKHQLRYEVAMR